MPVHELLDLAGRSAIVTGGGSGIGKQLAEGLAEAGANVILCARNAERCQQTAREFENAYGVAAIGLECDVRDPHAIRTAVELARHEFGVIDILVNNAGTSWGADAEDYPLEGWQKVLDVNLTGVFLFSQEVGRMMIEKGSGKIVNIGSAAALGGSPPELLNAIAYNTSKAAVISLTHELAVKWARHGICVNAIAPGWFPTDLSQAVLEREPQRHLATIPLGRFGGEEDLKGPVVFLASRASDYVTGHVLVVDGGLSIA